MYRWSMGGEEGEEGGVWRGFKGFGGMRGRVKMKMRRGSGGILNTTPTAQLHN